MRYGLIFSFFIFFSWAQASTDYKFQVKSQVKVYASDLEKEKAQLVDVGLSQNYVNGSHQVKFSLESKTVKIADTMLTDFIPQEIFYQYKASALEWRLGYQYFMLTESLGTYAYEELHAKIINPSVFADIEDLLSTTLGLKMTWYEKSFVAEVGLFDGTLKSRPLFFSNKQLIQAATPTLIQESKESYLDAVVRLRFQFEKFDMAFYGLSVYEKHFITEVDGSNLKYKQPQSNILGVSFSTDVGDVTLRSDLMVASDRTKLNKNMIYDKYDERLLSLNADYQFTDKNTTSVVWNYRQLPKADDYLLEESQNQIFIFHQYQYSDDLFIKGSYLHQDKPNADSYKLDFDRKVTRNVRISLGAEKWLQTNEVYGYIDIKATTF